jgi:hypothetical protein
MPMVANIYNKLRKPTVQSQCSGFRPFVTGSDELHTPFYYLRTCYLLDNLLYI